MLLFKKRFHEAIVRGEKTTTLRFWKRRQVRPGSVHVVPRLGRLRILDVAPSDLDALNEADAQADGFDGVAELRSALNEMYPQAERNGRTLYRVEFEFIADRDGAVEGS
jgi:hypothetical protein